MRVLAERLTQTARRVASGSLGYGFRGLAALLGLIAAKEMIAIVVGGAILVMLVAGVILLSWGLDTLGHAVSRH